MALLDYEALVHDLRQELRSGRSSWGRPQLLELLDDLEARHRISETNDHAVLRRFASHLIDTFLGLLPRPATDDPLTEGDPRDANGDGLRRSLHDDQIGGHDGRSDRRTPVGR